MMTITELQQRYAAHPNVEAMSGLLKNPSVRTLFYGGLCASAASLFSSVLVQRGEFPFVFILGNKDTMTKHPFYKKLWEYVEAINNNKTIQCY